MAVGILDPSQRTNPVKAAARMAQRLSVRDVGDARRKKEQADRELRASAALGESLFGIEATASAMVAKKTATLSADAKAFERLAKGSKYPLFSLEPLTWRDKQGYPRLVVFSLASPEFGLTSSFERVTRNKDGDWLDRERLTWNAVVSPNLPPVMKACYGDVLKLLKTMRTKRGRVQTTTLSTTFQGLIPTEAREAIRKASKDFKAVFIVAEPQGWALLKVPVPRPKQQRRQDPDPLVVGYDGEHFWLVTTFDLTPLEKLVESGYSIV